MNNSLVGDRQFEEIKAEIEAERERLRPKVLEAYGNDLSEGDIRTVIRVWREQNECEGCTGDCQKQVQRWSRPSVHKEFGGIYVHLAICKYGEEHFNRREFRRAGIPEKICNKTFADFKTTSENQAAIAIARKLLTSDKGAYFYGEPGTGKTFLAALVAKDFVRDFQSVTFREMPTLLAEIKDTFDTKESTEALLDRYCECDLLILDDVGAEKVTEWSTEQLFSIVNRRYNAQKKIIVTANFDLDGLTKRLGGDITAKRIVSRLREMTAQADFGTKDWRNSQC